MGSLRMLCLFDYTLTRATSAIYSVEMHVQMLRKLQRRFEFILLNTLEMYLFQSSAAYASVEFSSSSRTHTVFSFETKGTCIVKERYQLCAIVNFGHDRDPCDMTLE